jgi:hypothetical protein
VQTKVEKMSGRNELLVFLKSLGEMVRDDLEEDDGAY